MVRGERGKEQSPHITFHEYIKCTREMLYEAFHKFSHLPLKTVL